MARHLTIDVSVWDGDVDFDQWIDRHGLWGAIVKCGGNEGGRYRDRLFESHYDAAAVSGLNVGIYYYTTTTDPDEAAEDARHCLSILDGRELDLPIYIDVEDAGQATIGRRALTDVCLAFIHVIEEAGYRGGLYTSGSWWKNNVYADELRPYANWIAWWTYERPQSISDVDMWQFGSMRLSDGDVAFDDVGGYTDANYCYTDDGEDGGTMAREGWAEDIDECVDPADFAYCTCEVYSCGYSQPNRRCLSREHLIDGDAETDCSAGVSWWLYKGGMLDECPWFATAYQVEYLTDLGWELLDPDEEEPRRNDVLWRPGHTALYIGDGMQAEALRTERHDAGYDGSIPGDQDGGETMVREYPAGGWVWIIRSPDSLPEQRREEQDIPDEGDGAVYRFRDPGNGIHFLTASHDEAVSVSSWMDYEGVAFRVSGSGQTVYRLYDEGNGDHFLTTSKSERDTARGWMADEGVAFRTEGTRPVYRLIDRNDNTHFYTASRAERDACMDWMDYEGVAFSVLSEDGSVTYRAHCQTLGWLGWVSDGEVAGTLGERRRMEAIEIELPDGMVVDAMAHVQRLGDQWVRDASGRFTLGTTGRSLRIEGIMLDVKRSQGQSLRYRCHVQRIGWTDWCESGTFCGTRGQGLRVEAVQIMLS